MAQYNDLLLSDKTYLPNIVLKMLGEYFSLRQPDSGLTIDSDKNGTIQNVSLNATSIDALRPTSVINTNTFRIIDVQECITKLFQNNDSIFQGVLVETWIGRCNVGLDFADYFKLPDTYINKLTKLAGVYTFTTREAKDRLSKGAFTIQNKLSGNILAATTIITLQDASSFPISGLCRVGDEFFSYNGITGNNLQNCVRGEYGTTPANHDLGSDVFVAQFIEDNPINIFLQLMVSSGGGSVYDVLPDGAGIDQALIDIAEFEDVRGTYFSGQDYRFILWNVDNLRTFIENEILYPCGLRLRTNNNSKIGCAVLNHPIINLDNTEFSHDNITSNIGYSVDENKIINKFLIEWDFSDATQSYLQVTQYQDDDSITEFGERKPLVLKFKGIRDALNGQSIVDQIADEFINRFSYPKPVLDLSSHLEQHLWLLGEKPFLESTQVPTPNGDLNFGENVEVIERAINFNTGDVRFKLQFTQFTGIRVCYLCPSDMIVTVISADEFEIAAGRGAEYRVGWVLRLYNKQTNTYEPDSPRTISEINGDIIKFDTPFLSSITAGIHMLKFADYDEVNEQQKKFCFTGCGSDFDDGKPQYKIVC